MKLTPTSPGLAGGPLFVDSPLNSLICPECPWRKQMTPGYNVGMPSDSSMFQAATTRTLPTYTTNADGTRVYGTRPGAQGCHMITDKRCRGAETFRANIGLDSEVPKNDCVAESFEQIKEIWARRGYVESKEILWGPDPRFIGAK